MKNFQTKNHNTSSFKHSWFFLFVLFIILFLFGKSAYASFIKKHNADLEQQKYQEKFDELEQKKVELESRIHNLKTPRGREEELRKIFNIVKDGETMIRIIDETERE